jgi:hypothetical protein
VCDSGQRHLDGASGGDAGMDVRQVALALSLVVFGVSALVYILVFRHYRAALRRFERKYAKDREQGRQQSVKLRIPEPPRAPTTVGHLSLIVAVFSLVSTVVLGILQLLK